MENAPKPKVSKRRLNFLVVFLFVWPIILIIAALQPIYGLVGTEAEPSTVNQVLGTASLLVYIGLYLGPVSWIIGIYLLYKRMRKK